MTKKILLGIDAGSEKSGVIVITDGAIREGYNILNVEIMAFVQAERANCEQLVIVIEDVRPYNMRITDGIVQTIKFIGQLEWRLQDAGLHFTLIPRWQVKQWVFMQFKPLMSREIQKKMDTNNKRREKEGQNLQNKAPHFAWIDDRMVAMAMREWWKIKKPEKIGQRAAYNLKDHSWQALGLVSYYMALNGLKIGH